MLGMWRWNKQWIIISGSLPQRALHMAAMECSLAKSSAPLSVRKQQLTFCFILIFLTPRSLALSKSCDNDTERAVRPLATQRNGMLHFGSDEEAKMAATYHSIISTVKLQGRSAWDYLGKFFVNIFNGCRDFFSLRPDKIGLAICQ